MVHAMWKHPTTRWLRQKILIHGSDITLSGQRLINRSDILFRRTVCAILCILNVVCYFHTLDRPLSRHVLFSFGSSGYQFGCIVAVSRAGRTCQKTLQNIVDVLQGDSPQSRESRYECRDELGLGCKQKYSSKKNFKILFFKFFWLGHSPGIPHQLQKVSRSWAQPCVSP